MRNISFLGCWMMLVSLCVSPAGMSIGTVFLLLGALGSIWEKRKQLRLEHPLWVVGFWIYFCWVALSFFWTENTDIYLVDLRIKLPFLLLPFAFGFIPTFSRKEKLILMVSYCFSQLIIALFTIAGYLQNFEENIDRVKKNSALEIVGGTNHIYFGVTLALAIIVGFHLFIHHKTYFPKVHRAFSLLYVILATACLHSLTSRTGLVAFYGGFASYFLVYILNNKKWKLGLIILAILIITPLVSYHLIPSFKYRVDVTLWDLEVSGKEGADLNYQSVGLRIKTWECCLEVWKEEPVLGVGFADLGEELFACYREIDLQADESKWLKSAHNQYLEQLSGGGIPGLLILLTLFLLPLIRVKFKEIDELEIGILAVLAAGMLTESLLERQLGINLFLLMYFLLVKKNES